MFLFSSENKRLSGEMALSLTFCALLLVLTVGSPFVDHALAGAKPHGGPPMKLSNVKCDAPCDAKFKPACRCDNPVYKFNSATKGWDITCNPDEQP